MARSKSVGRWRTDVSLRDVAAQRKAERENNGKLHGIAAIRAQKQEAREGGLAALRQQRKMSSKLDFTIDGIRYHNAHIHNRDDRPWGTISVSNGDKTYELHNRYGSWMCNLDGDRHMAEPAAVARALGISMTHPQLEVSQALTERYYRELKAQGVPTPEERIRQREEEARKQRRSNRNTNDDKE